MQFLVENAGVDPNPTPRSARVVAADGSPIPPWAANSETSRWVGLDGDDSIGPAGEYLYEVRFELPLEFNAFKTQLAGSWTAAGRGADV
ncbi:MAG: hypothetical protein O7J95_01555, partial [Planctomycetota bacterium]|nr:hypothetical protein [Planctomycetota bacterium]